MMLHIYICCFYCFTSSLLALEDVAVLIQPRLLPRACRAHEAIWPPALNQGGATGFGDRKSLTELPHVLGITRSPHFGRVAFGLTGVKVISTCSFSDFCSAGSR